MHEKLNNKEHVAVYLAGPITRSPELELARASIISNFLIELGIVPFVPQLSIVADAWLPDMMNYDAKYSFWMGHDQHVLKQNDALLLLPGNSRGADQELVWAKELNIPVYKYLTLFLEDCDHDWRWLIEHGTVWFTPEQVKSIICLSRLYDLDEIQNEVSWYAGLRTGNETA